MAADSGRAIRRAMVRIFGQELRENRSTSTDERGAYEFADLPAGRYTISASKAGFVGLNYGQLRPLESGKPLQLGDNETAKRIDLRLPRGSVITGRIVDEFGEPVANAVVQALQFRYMNGQKRPVNSSSPATTPDTGEFRLWGLGWAFHPADSGAAVRSELADEIDSPPRHRHQRHRPRGAQR